MNKSRLFMVICALLAVPSEVWSAPITFEEGTGGGGNWYVGGDGPLESSSVALGITSFNYTFNPKTPDSDPSPDWGFYGDAIKSCNLTMGAYIFSCDNSKANSIELGHYNGTERYFASATLKDAFGFSDIHYTFFTEWVSVPRGSFLPEVDELITEPWSPVSSDTFRFIEYTYEGTSYTGRRQGSGSYWTSVPEPSEILLFTTGLLGLVFVRRKQRKDSSLVTS